MLIVGALLECAVLVLLLFGLGRLAGNRLVLALGLGGFALRCAIGETLYFISARGLPVLTSLQLGDGFWKFAMDPPRYHEEGLQVATSLGGPPPPETLDFAWVLGGVYRVFGGSPGQGLLLVAAAAAATLPLAYIALSHAGAGYRASLAGAIAVGFWPSSLVWSSQLLKDSLIWLGLFSVLAGTSALMNARTASHSKLTLGAATVAVVFGMLVLGWLRGYSAPALLPGLVLGGLVCVAVNWRQQRRESVLSIGVLMVALLVGSAASLSSVQEAAGMGLQTISTIETKRPPETQNAPIPLAPAPARGRPAAPSPAGQGSPAALQTSTVPPEAANRIPGSQPTAAAQPPGRLPMAATQPPGSLPSAPRIVSNEESYYQGDRVCPATGRLMRLRYGFLNTGGASIVDANVPFHDCYDIIKYLPRAAELAFIAPLPWDWSDQAMAGSIRRFTFVDAGLLWLALPGVLAGLLIALKRGNGFYLAIVLYAVLLGSVLGVMVPNFGTLFRLRLTIALPVMLVAVDGWARVLTWWPRSRHTPARAAEHRKSAKPLRARAWRSEFPTS